MESLYIEYLKSDADWVIMKLCTTGHKHLSRWFVGTHTDRGQTKTTLDIGMEDNFYSHIFKKNCLKF